MDRGISPNARPATGLRAISATEHMMANLAKHYSGAPVGTKKGKFLATVKQAAPALDVSEKCIYLLDQLMAFSQERDWESGRHPIVWPSNEMLCDTLGIGKRALQYRLKTLRDSGLIVSSYGPQERRYGRRGPDGHIVEAYGFDLSPLAIRQEEFQAMADQQREKRAQRQALRRRKTIAVKALSMVCATAFELDLGEEEWRGFEARGRELALQARSVRDIAPLTDLVNRLEMMRADVEAHFQTQAQLCSVDTSEEEKINTAPEGAKTCTTNTTTTDLKFNKLNTVDKQKTKLTEKSSQAEPVPEVVTRQTVGEDPIEKTITKYQIHPKMVAQLSPFFANMMGSGEPVDWKAIGDAGYKTYRLAGISEHAWNDAVSTLGREAAAILIVIILCKRKDLRKPGGYFRGMVDKGRHGELNLGPTLYALRDKANAETTATV